MNPIAPFILAAAVLAAPLTLRAADEAPPTKEEFDRLTRLQIFLDDANFPPGKIDGRWGEFTRKSLARYLRAQGEDVPEFGDEVPKDLPVDPASVDPIYTTYTVEQADLDRLGSAPSEPEEQAKQDAMPYATLTELIGERYHVDRDYLTRLNEGRQIDSAQVGDTLTVPNVANPFLITEIEKRAEEQKQAKEKTESSESDEGSPENDSATADASPTPSPTPAIPRSIFISTADKMLDLYDGKKLVASFPITPGSESLPAPTGDWKITSITLLPWFRHDEKMLEEGERSDDAHNIPPGPNNAVGIVWIAIDKKGIGLHGTAAPDTIGRGGSHGCIRLANWDAARLAGMVDVDTPVRIE